MRKIQLSAFISVLPGAELGGIPDGEVVCTSAYADGGSFESVMGEVAQNLRAAVRDAREGDSATPCNGPRPRMCPMGLRQMRVQAEREDMGEFAYAFFSKVLARFERGIELDVDWWRVEHMSAEDLDVPEWLMDGIYYECAKSLENFPIFASLLDEFTRVSIAPFFYGLNPSRPLVLFMLAKAYFAEMLDALPRIEYGGGPEPLDDWCFHQDCPCGIAHVFDDAGNTNYLCPRYPDL